MTRTRRLRRVDPARLKRRASAGRSTTLGCPGRGPAQRGLRLGSPPSPLCNCRRNRSTSLRPRLRRYARSLTLALAPSPSLPISPAHSSDAGPARPGPSFSARTRHLCRRGAASGTRAPACAIAARAFDPHRPAPFCTPAPRCKHSPHVATRNAPRLRPAPCRGRPGWCRPGPRY